MNCYNSLYTNLLYRIIFLIGGKENLGQYLARSLSLVVIVDPAEGIEIIESTHPSLFPGVIIMNPPLQALEAAKKY